MTQLRRVRALHLAPCCTLHTYSIGRATSQRNNIATIHHTSAVNKTSGSFLLPSSFSSLLHFLSTLQFFLAIYFLPSFAHVLFHRVTVPLQSFSLSDSHSDHVFAASAYLFDFFLPSRSFTRPLAVPRSVFFARLIFSLLDHPFPPLLPSHTRIFFLSTFPPCSMSIRFPVCAVLLLSLSFSFLSHSLSFSFFLFHSCPMSTLHSVKKRPHHD